MKRQALMVCSLILLAGLMPVFAQPSVTARFDVPFEFVVGDITLPAGSYTVIYELKTSLLMVCKDNGSPSVIVLTSPTQANQVASGTKLLFNRYGAKHFLSRLWVTGDDRGCEVHKTNYEKEIMAQGPQVRSIQLAAR